MGKAAAGGGFAVVVVVCMPGAARRRELVGRNIVPGTRNGRKRHQAVSLSPSRRGRLRESVFKGGAGRAHVARAILLLLRSESMTASTSSSDSTLAVWPTKTDWRSMMGSDETMVGQGTAAGLGAWPFWFLFATGALPSPPPLLGAAAAAASR